MGTFDGFWAFEMERRGAAEVVASDVASFDALDWSRPARARRAARRPVTGPGERFALAAELLGSQARRVECRMDELDAERLGGPVDLALVGDCCCTCATRWAGSRRCTTSWSPAGG